jgi:O-antigen biosynthesis protein
MNPCLPIFWDLLTRNPVVASKILWWWGMGRRVRARAQLCDAAKNLPRLYRHWLACHQPEQADRQALAKPLRPLDQLPLLAVHLHYDCSEFFQSTNAEIRSVFRQLYPRWELYLTSTNGSLAIVPNDPRVRAVHPPVANRAAGIASVLEITRAPYLIPLAVGSTLAPGALLAYAQAVQKENGEVVLYADQDERAPRGGRCNPWFKPEWDEDLFLAQDYVSAACAIPTKAARQVNASELWSDAITIYGLLARLLLGPAAIGVHRVPYVATTTPAGAWHAEVPERRKLVQTIVRETMGGDVLPNSFGTLNLQRALPTPAPQVSVIVPTRDRVDLLETCVKGVLDNTDYHNIELLIIDNDSTDPSTLGYLRHCSVDPRVKVLRWPHPYNYSAINNFAVAQARGPYICLLNNDTEVVDPAWLNQMMVHAVRPEVGAVGARLLYPDRTVQHAGVVVGLGGAAGHAHRGLRQGEPGYFAQALVTRGATAVTAACLVISKDKYLAVGGLDEEGLAIAYNDVDLCLKLREANWRNIYVAQAVLIHHESKSRGLDFAPEHLARYKRELSILQERWKAVGFQDPTHHPALDPASETFRLKL